MRHRFGIALALTLWSGSLWADSDGYFCYSSQFLAYDVNFQSAASSHALKIVRLDPSSRLGPQSVTTVSLPDFQVHRLLCTETEVQLLGWNHLFRVASPGDPSPLLVSEELAHPGFVPASLATAGTLNLGPLSLAARDHTVQSLQLSPHFQLRIAAERKDPCTIHVNTELLQQGPEAKHSSKLKLYEDRFERDCH